MTFTRDWPRGLLFKFYTKHLSIWQCCVVWEECAGFWMSFLTGLLMSLVNSVSGMFTQICVYSMHIFLLKYNCICCVVCRDELWKSGLSASCKSFMTLHSLPQPLKCRTPNNFLKRNLKTSPDYITVYSI